MTEWDEVSPGVFFARPGSPVLATEKDLDRLILAAKQSPLRRARLCAHSSPTDAIHEMLICLLADGYIRPHRHFKVESACVLRGEAELVLFEDDGRLRETIALGPVGSGRTCFVRLSAPVFHTYLLRSEAFVFLETTSGPLNPAESEFAAWSPGDVPAGMEYSRQLQRFSALSRSSGT